MIFTINSWFTLLFCHSSSSSDTTPEKKAKTHSEDNSKTSTDNSTDRTAQSNSSINVNSEPTHSESTEDLDDDRPKKVLIPRYRIERSGERQSKTIPGLGIYSDSSDSESSSSDSEILTTNSFVKYR